MNTILLTVFVVVSFLGALMFLWWLFMLRISAGVGAELDRLGCSRQTAPLRWRCITGVANLVAVLLPAGYFFDPWQVFYAQHPFLMTAVLVFTVISAAMLNDSMHHRLLRRISISGCVSADRLVADNQTKEG